MIPVWMQALFAKDRRRHKRFPAAQAGLIRIEGTVLRGRIEDVSRGGFLFRPTMAMPLLGSASLTLTVNGLTLAACIQRRSQAGLHCRFLSQLSEDEVSRLQAGAESEAAKAPAAAPPPSPDAVRPASPRPAEKRPVTPKTDIAI